MRACSRLCVMSRLNPNTLYCKPCYMIAGSIVRLFPNGAPPSGFFFASRCGCFLGSPVLYSSLWRASHRLLSCVAQWLFPRQPGVVWFLSRLL